MPVETSITIAERAPTLSGHLRASAGAVFGEHRERRRHRRERRRSGAPHSSSLIFWPGESVAGSSSGLSAISVSRSTPAFSAMPDAVSPALTV